MGRTVAFIGLGIMGGRMVKNVLKAGYSVRAQNRTGAKAEAVKPLGATVAATPREAAAGADIVVTMVAQGAGKGDAAPDPWGSSPRVREARGSDGTRARDGKEGAR